MPFLKTVFFSVKKIKTTKNNALLMLIWNYNDHADRVSDFVLN